MPNIIRSLSMPHDSTARRVGCAALQVASRARTSEPGAPAGYARWPLTLPSAPRRALQLWTRSSCRARLGARLVATDHTNRSDARVVERNCKAALPREVSTRSDRNDDRRAGQLVEGCGGYDHDWAGPPLFMALAVGSRLTSQISPRSITRVRCPQAQHRAMSDPRRRPGRPRRTATTAPAAREEPPSSDRQSAVFHPALDHDPQPGLAYPIAGPPADMRSRCEDQGSNGRSHPPGTAWHRLSLSPERQRNRSEPC